MGMLRDNRKDELEVLGDGEMDVEKHLVKDHWKDVRGALPRDDGKDIKGATKGHWGMMGCMLKGARDY
jgi:hypothetical protein